MTEYFVGRRTSEPIHIPVHNGHAILQCTVTEAWEPICNRTIRCGAKQSIKITRKIGVRKSDKEVIAGTIEGSIGLAGITQLKSVLTGTRERQLDWSEEKSVEETFEFPAPQCGRYLALVYQLMRTIDLHYQDSRIRTLWASWRATIHESTEDLFDDSKSIKNDDACGCADEVRKADPDGFVQIALGSVSMVVPYRRTDEAFVLEIHGKELRTELDLTQSFPGTLRGEFIPPHIAFLMTGERRIYEQYTVNVSPYAEKQITPTSMLEIVLNRVAEPDSVQDASLMERYLKE
jgi:hypothetical protein